MYGTSTRTGYRPVIRLARVGAQSLKLQKGYLQGTSKLAKAEALRVVRRQGDTTPDQAVDGWRECLVAIANAEVCDKRGDTHTNTNPSFTDRCSRDHRRG